MCRVKKGKKKGAGDKTSLQSDQVESTEQSSSNLTETEVNEETVQKSRRQLKKEHEAQKELERQEEIKAKRRQRKRERCECQGITIHIIIKLIK